MKQKTKKQIDNVLKILVYSAVIAGIATGVVTWFNNEQHRTPTEVMIKCFVNSYDLELPRGHPDRVTVSTIVVFPDGGVAQAEGIYGKIGDNIFVIRKGSNEFILTP